MLLPLSPSLSRSLSAFRNLPLIQNKAASLSTSNSSNPPPSSQESSSSKTAGTTPSGNLKNVDQLLAPYQTVLTLPIQWGLMDAFGHLNAVHYFRFFESARVDYFDKLLLSMHPEDPHRGFMSGNAVGPIVHSISCRYLFPVTYPDSLILGTRVQPVDHDRFVMEHIAISKKMGKACAKGDSLIVTFDYVKQEKCSTPESILSAFVKMNQKK